MSNVPTITIKCSQTDCKNDRHNFNDREYKRLGRGRNFLAVGVCKQCGASGVDWTRAHARNKEDIDYVMSVLQREQIRFVFWSLPFNGASLAKFELLGRTKTFEGINVELSRTIGPVARAGWSYKQVPSAEDKMTDVIQYAQHAVAVRCRKCVQKWHGIPNLNPLSTNEVDYLSLLVQRYLEMRLPLNVPK